MQLKDLVYGVDLVGENFFALPNTEAYRIIGSMKAWEAYKAEFGENTEVIRRESPFHKYWDVPNFEAGRKTYSDAKAKECAIWGCE